MRPEHVHVFPGSTFENQIGSAQSTALDRWALSRIQQFVAGARLQFVLWDGFALVPSVGPPVATILFKNRRALFSWVWDPELNVGETYMFGAVDIRGDLVAALEEIYRSFGDTRSTRSWRRAANDLSTAQANVHHHYDLGNEFYKLWLDREMVYTCAYFPTRDCTLEEAQLAKMDLVCRKLHLQPGEHVIEAGCGWGSLALFMAKHYGVSVRALNVSAEQVTYARDRAAREGLGDRVEFIADDYRNVKGECDAFVSVGMLEHVGLPDYDTLGRVINRSLKKNGRGFLHFIGRNRPAPLSPWIRKRIFPGAYPPTLSEVFERILVPHAFSVLDVENLRLHYAQTLRHWRQRFEERLTDIEQMFDDNFARAWGLYLAGAQTAFTTGTMQLFQVLFARGADNAIPWTHRFPGNDWT